MTVDQRHQLEDAMAILDAVFAERESKAAELGGAMPHLWQQIRSAADGGKRIRPRLVLLAHATLDGAAHDDAARAAAAVELLHTALLLHDDLLDGDLVRRGRPNLQGAHISAALQVGAAPHMAAAWGDAAGLLAGDLLISAVHMLVADLALAHRRQIHQIIDDCLFTTVAGELADIGLTAGMTSATVVEIRSMMRQKTAGYSFSAPLRIGALMAEASAEVMAELDEIGTMLGFLYQLRDDLLGVFGTPERAGKSVDGDLREGKRTLLVAYAEGSEAWNDVQHLFGARSLEADEAALLRDALVTSGARERAESDLALAQARTSERIRVAALPEPLQTALLHLCDHAAGRTR